MYSSSNRDYHGGVASPVIIAGWLGKMKRAPKLLTRWNKRWVTIQDGAIQWRHSKDQDPAAGEIKLENVDRAYKLNALKQNNRFNSSSNSNSSNNNNTVLIVRSKKRNLCLMARSNEDCDRWVRAIQMQLDLRDGGTVSGPRCTRNRRSSNGGGDKYKVCLCVSDLFCPSRCALIWCKYLYLY